MCGIAGYTSFFKPVEDADRVLQSMLDTLIPRGPDGGGYHATPSIHLGHRRLSIIDIQGGTQPMSCGQQRYHIIFNGEIYNYIELREQLQVQGRTFRTQSDTEVLLQQYAVDGVAALGKLNGIFAFAIWDRERETLFLARDRLGVKPLYYTVQGQELIFASELKALRQHPAVTGRIDITSVSKYLTYGYIPAPHTIFEGIHKLEPGHYLQFDRKGLVKESYWDIPLEDNPVCGLSVDDCAEELLQLLDASVKLQLRSDVPVGVFLSGGLDSSVLTALAARSLPRKLHTFSVGFEEDGYDESPYARRVADLYGTEHHHEVLSQQRALAMLPQVMRILDEPFADASILPTYLLSQFTAREVKVTLGGDGGDELFMGYPSFQAHKLMEAMSILPVTWRDGLNRLAKKIPVSHNYASFDFLVQTFFKGAGVSPEIRFFLWMGYFGNEEKRQLLTPEIRDRLLRTNPFEDVVNYIRQSRLIGDVARIQYLCLKMYLQDDILVKVDRASMANSLEVRVPFLDHDLVEYASKIQAVYKLKGFTTKYILKRGVQAQKLLPRDIIHRRKAGFMIPLAQWLKKDLRPILEDLCSAETIRQDGFFDPAYVRTMLDEHFTHVRDHRKSIWALLCFQLWLRNNGRVTTR